MIAHLDDLESDFSRFHRVDDIWEMDGPRFLRMAWRIEAYGGVMALRRQARLHDHPQVAGPSGPRDDDAVSLVQFMSQVPGAVELTRVEA